MWTLPLLVAQASHVAGEVTTSADRGFNWIALFDPAVVWVFIPIVAIVVGAMAKIIQRSQEHRERMAMIAAGLHPDYPPDESPDDDGSGSGLLETTAHRSV